MGVLLHLTVADYPLPEPGNLLPLWGGMIVPATIVTSSLSFALGTALPRQANLVKILVLMGWFVGVVIIPTSLTSLPAWYIAWDPTSAATARSMMLHFEMVFNNLPQATSQTQLLLGLQAVENTVSDVSAWLAPHLIEAGLSLLLVLLVAFTFQRFRNALGAE